ncbi:MAG: WecB/TagA/CpsF family glycosyltransferase [Actinomycetota bacterium]
MGTSTTGDAATFAVGGVRIDALALPTAVARLVEETGPRAVHLCNAYTVALADRDPALRAMLNADDLVLPDGMPIVWVGRRRGAPGLPGRVYGPDLMAGALDRGRAHGIRHHLYGSTPDVLDRLRRVIGERWPGAEIVGAESPPFRDLTDADLRAATERMAASGADLVWVGLGTPKQDDAVHRLARLGPATYVAVGAAFDFLAGTKRQAPVWMQRRGLEWCFRLATEPRRLWRRYLIGNLRFVRAVLRRDRGSLTAPA